MRHFTCLLACSLGSFILMTICGGNLWAQQSPVAVHTGVSYVRLPKADFEVVRSLGGQDFFSRTNLQDDRVEFAAFLSQRVWERGPVQGYATVGTGVNDPGSVVYLGGSAGFSRTLVTVGAATSMIKRGLNPVRDSVFGGTGDRVLFSSLDRQRKWGFFIGLSFAVIH